MLSKKFRILIYTQRVFYMYYDSKLIFHIEKNEIKASAY